MKARVLIVEDNQESLELMLYLLKAFDYDTLAAVTGEDGVDLARRECPELILCDIHLPGISGYEVAGRIKADPALHGVPMIAVTALAMVGDRDKILAAGFEGYIAKPIAPETFIKQIEAFIPTARHGSPQSTAPSLPAEPEKAVEKRDVILVVDDSDTNRQLIRASLEPSGFKVLLADSVDAAAKVMKTSAVDLILSDMHMPEDSGLALLEIARADPRLSPIPFVFISSSRWTPRERSQVNALSPTLLLSRPIEPIVLIEEIKWVLERRKKT